MRFGLPGMVGGMDPLYVDSEVVSTPHCFSRATFSPRSQAYGWKWGVGLADMGLESSGNAVALSGQATARSGGSATVQLKYSLWVTWSEIAIEHEAAAWRARWRSVNPTDPAGGGDPMEDEFRASLQAVTTAALALDALHVPVKAIAKRAGADQAGSSPREGARREGIIREWLKAVFLVGKLNEPWVQEFQWLFCLRDGAVHYGESAEDPAPHPLGLSVSKAHSTYHAEAAKRAVDLLMEVLHLVAERPKPKFREAVDWSAGIKASVRKLDELRVPNRGDGVTTLSGNQPTADST